MSKGLVLITGGSGHIGFKTLVVALEQGYRVRAAVRSETKAQLILNAPSIKRLGAGDDGRLTFVVVPDFLAPSAFDAAVRDVDYAIHIASPITGGKPDFDAELIQPALRGTLGFLESAHAHARPTLKRIVITSSVAALISWSQVSSTETITTPLQEHDRIPSPQGPYTVEFEAYCASKVLTLNATETWLATHRPAFSLVHVHPGYVLGRDELVTTPADLFRGTNRVVLRPVALGQHIGPFSSSAVHLDDVAEAHVAALDTARVPDRQSLVLAAGAGSEGITYDDAMEIVARRFPRAVEKGVLRNDGTVGTRRTPFDKTRTLEVLGWKEMRSFEDAVVDVVGHYLEVNGVEVA